MKKFNILAIALMGMAAFSSCSTDRDSNPTLSVPQSFELLVPEIGSNVINLENSESVQFKAKTAPDYGFPTETSYWIEVTEEADFSNPEKVFSTDTKGNKTVYDAPANEIDYAIMQIRGYEEESQVDKNEVITLNIRMVASIAHDTDGSTYVYSNPQAIKVTPYFLKESLPEVWYLTGGAIADGSWGCDAAVIGTKMIPMYVKSGEEYNKFTGKGVVEYVGYFQSGNGFKIIEPKGLGNWNYDMCGNSGLDIADGEGYDYRDGGDDNGDISVAASGYYRLVLDTKEHELKTEAYEPDEPVVNYTSMKIGDNDLAPMTTVADVPNHDWYAVITLDAPTNLYFTANDGTEWGTDAFPYGIGTTDGNKIPVAKGTFIVYFNDITGAYMFTEQK